MAKDAAVGAVVVTGLASAVGGVEFAPRRDQRSAVGGRVPAAAGAQVPAPRLAALSPPRASTAARRSPGPAARAECPPAASGS